jgi:hypothetical protein
MTVNAKGHECMAYLCKVRVSVAQLMSRMSGNFWPPKTAVVCRIPDFPDFFFFPKMKSQI